MPLHRGNLFLVGLPGAGKSTLGRQLARRLGKRFVDADAELEQRLGVSITTIFEIEGESGFRDREEMVLADLTCMANIVLSTGGGAVLRPGNRARLKENGTVIYLHAEPTTLYGRIRHSRNRPLLRTTDQLARLAELYAPARRAVPGDRRVRGGVGAWRSDAPGAPIRGTASAMTTDERTLDVGLGARSYPIHIGAGTVARAGPVVAGEGARRAVIVTNETVASHWLAALARIARRERRGQRRRHDPGRRGAQELHDAASRW